VRLISASEFVRCLLYLYHTESQSHLSTHTHTLTSTHNHQRTRYMCLHSPHTHTYISISTNTSYTTHTHTHTHIRIHHRKLTYKLSSTLIHHHTHVYIPLLPLYYTALRRFASLFHRVVLFNTQRSSLPFQLCSFAVLRRIDLPFGQIKTEKQRNRERNREKRDRERETERDRTFKQRNATHLLFLCTERAQRVKNTKKEKRD
jgi:hypothetical protein